MNQLISKFFLMKYQNLLIKKQAIFLKFSFIALIFHFHIHNHQYLGTIYISKIYKY
jgi:hypothetical protein